MDTSLEAKNKIAIVTTKSTTPKALAAPQLKYSSMLLEIFIAAIMTLPPPRTAGVT